MREDITISHGLRKSSIWLAFVSLLVFIVLAAPRCSSSEPEPTSSDNVVSNDNNFLSDNPIGNIDLPGSSLPESTPGNQYDSGLNNSAAMYALLQDEKNTAIASIRALQEDVILALVSLKFVNGLSDSNLVTNYYIYLSASNPDYYYLVNMPRNSASLKRFLMPKEDLALPFNLLEVQDQYWKLSYADALQEVEKRGGLTFRANHPDAFEVSAILAKPANQFTNWFITYRATDGTGEVFKATVDAVNGETTIVGN
ncbi:hypothetical protein DRH29_01755 [candidate division Kazan bacterium]|uniref:PepSY domain-containing protein n=1 Tax=candidate division Kazan bacterium TaxID=2202143 RepID=A0A420ZCZ4_UNCK3|nr:MAG: hypothetical protein DRH29_01755 [candidate division Kazan bacterium]